MYAKRVGNGDASAFEAAYAPSDFVLAGQLGAYHENLTLALTLNPNSNSYPNPSQSEPEPEPEPEPES